jgi:hypothetical protein
MTPQERIEQQLQRAEVETAKKEEEIRKERERLSAIDENEFDAAEWIRKMSRGIRGR